MDRRTGSNRNGLTRRLLCLREPRIKGCAAKIMCCRRSNGASVQEKDGRSARVRHRADRGGASLCARRLRRSLKTERCLQGRRTARAQFQSRRRVDKDVEGPFDHRIACRSCAASSAIPPSCRSHGALSRDRGERRMAVCRRAVKSGSMEMIAGQSHWSSGSQPKTRRLAAITGAEQRRHRGRGEALPVAQRSRGRRPRHRGDVDRAQCSGVAPHRGARGEHGALALAAADVRRSLHRGQRSRPERGRSSATARWC